MNMSTRAEVFEAINSEREYQEKKWSRPAGSVRSVGEEILCMEECLSLARQCWKRGDDFDREQLTGMLNHIRKVAAVAVRCMEQHGSPKRGEN